VKKKVLFEDATMGYNKWVSGQASREFASQRMKFKDLVSQDYDTDQSPNTAKADNVLPYQLINAANILSELISNTVGSINAFKNALEAPIVKKDKKLEEEVSTIISHLEDSMSCLKNVIRTVGEDSTEIADPNDDR